jgi:hypothetical protein
LPGLRMRALWLPAWVAAASMGKGGSGLCGALFARSFHLFFRYCSVLGCFSLFAESIQLNSTDDQ